MAERRGRTRAPGEKEAPDIERLKERLNMLDQRLDNIDSMVTAIAERVMSRPVTLSITCPHCDKSIEIAIIGSERLKR